MKPDADATSSAAFAHAAGSFADRAGSLLDLRKIMFMARRRSRLILGSAAAVGASASLPRFGWAAVPQVGDDMAKTAQTWLAKLDARQRGQAQLDWANRRREDWHYVPRGRPGLAFRDMAPEQVAAAWDVLGSLLSARGIGQVRGQLKIEGVLGELSGSLSFRDSGNYALVLFGDPAGTAAPWAWRPISRASGSAVFAMAGIDGLSALAK